MKQFEDPRQAVCDKCHAPLYAEPKAGPSRKTAYITILVAAILVVGFFFSSRDDSTGPRKKFWKVEKGQTAEDAAPAEEAQPAALVREPVAIPNPAAEAAAPIVQPVPPVAQADSGPSAQARVPVPGQPERESEIGGAPGVGNASAAPPVAEAPAPAQQGGQIVSAEEPRVEPPPPRRPILPHQLTLGLNLAGPAPSQVKSGGSAKTGTAGYDALMDYIVKKKAAKAETDAARIPNGGILRTAVLDGSGILKIRNDTPLDAVMKLIDITKKNGVVAFFVQAKSSCAVSGIRDGQYTLLFSTGRDYRIDRRRFESGFASGEFNTKLEFSSPAGDAAGPAENSTYEITLQSASEADGKSKTISNPEFEAY